MNAPGILWYRCVYTSTFISSERNMNMKTERAPIFFISFLLFDPWVLEWPNVGSIFVSMSTRSVHRYQIRWISSINSTPQQSSSECGTSHHSVDWTLWWILLSIRVEKSSLPCYHATMLPCYHATMLLWFYSSCRIVSEPLPRAPFDK